MSMPTYDDGRVLTPSDIHMYGLFLTWREEWELYRAGHLMGPIDHPLRPIQVVVQRFIDELLPAVQASWEELKEFLEAMQEETKARRNGPRRRYRPPMVISPPKRHQSRHRRSYRHGRRPREHQFRRTKTRDPPDHQPRRST